MLNIQKKIIQTCYAYQTHKKQNAEYSKKKKKILYNI